jgi:SAM-dependent methyltransferase
VTTAPYPPLALANRVGCLDAASDPWRFYDALGTQTRESILAALPADWKLEGARVLDFGCGAGRTLRHFLSEAETARFSGCDIDTESIDWLQTHLSPPLNAFVNAVDPPLPCPDGAFDLVYAISVFTHLSDNWSQWLLELRRVLADDGLLFVTFIGEGAAHTIDGQPWDADRIGMNVTRYGADWALGGPMVLHSPWWIEAHWGRAFDILDLRPAGFPDARAPADGHGTVLMRKRSDPCTPEELQAPEPGEPREAVALAYNRERLFAETYELRQACAALEAAGRPAADGEVARLQAELRQADATMTALTTSPSWRLTAPLRAAKRLVHW